MVQDHMVLEFQKSLRHATQYKGTIKDQLGVQKRMFICFIYLHLICLPLHQVLITTSSIPFEPSQPTLLLPAQRKPYLEIYCQFGYGFLGSSIYNSIIIIASCYYAFKARKIPDNYNESKFIAVSVYSTLIVSIAAVPVYTTATSVAQKIGALNVVLLVNTYLTLFCLYIPKLYAIHFASEDIQKTWGALSGTGNVSRSQPRLQPTSNQITKNNDTDVKVSLQ